MAKTKSGAKKAVTTRQRQDHNGKVENKDENLQKTETEL
jgi:hypothetical protein